MTKKNTTDQILKYLKTNFEDALLDDEEQEENKQILDELGFQNDCLIYELYKNYDIDCFYFDTEDAEEFLFDSLSLIADLKDSFAYTHTEWLVPDNYIPISDGEAGYYTFYDNKNYKVYFCDIKLANDIPKNAERHWDSFEDFFIEYMDLKV